MIIVYFCENVEKFLFLLLIYYKISCYIGIDIICIFCSYKSIIYCIYG